MSDKTTCDDCGKNYETDANISICPACYERALEEEGVL